MQAVLMCPDCGFSTTCLDYMCEQCGHLVKSESESSSGASRTCEVCDGLVLCYECGREGNYAEVHNPELIQTWKQCLGFRHIPCRRCCPKGHESMGFYCRHCQMKWQDQSI